MDEKLVKDTDALKDTGIEITDIKQAIARAEQKIYVLSRVVTKKGQFESVVKQAQKDIDALKKDIEELEAELQKLAKGI